MLSEGQIEQLEEFNKLADRLITSRYIKVSKEKKPKRNLSWHMNDQTRNLDFGYSRDKVHDEESIMSLVLTLRLLIQSDPSSIREMAKIYEDMPIDPNYKIRFRRLRKHLNEYLGSLAITTTKDDLKIGEILRTIIYGEYAHREDAKREVMKKWQMNSGDWDMVLGEFESALYQFVSMITPMKVLNEEVLKQCSKSTSSSSP